MVRDGRFFNKPDRRHSEHGLYPSSGSNMYHGHHRYHPYRRSDREYFMDEFNKAKPPTFDGELKKLEDSKAWLLRMKKLFELHDYIENMKFGITNF